MDFHSRTLADAIVAAPTGQIDHGNAMRLKEALDPLVEKACASKSPLVLDFERVDYISSMGLRVLMMVAKDMHAHGAPAAVAALRPVVQEIFDIARFQYVLQVFPTVRAALDKLSPPAAAAYVAGSR
jgi:anti-anti-sigma factor